MRKKEKEKKRKENWSQTNHNHHTCAIHEGRGRRDESNDVAE